MKPKGGDKKPSQGKEPDTDGGGTHGNWPDTGGE